MKTIMKYAKTLAIRDKSKELTIDHLRRAVAGLIVKDDVRLEELLKAIGIEPEAFRRCQVFSGDEIELADAYPYIKYDARVWEIRKEFSQEKIPVEIYRSRQTTLHRLLDFKNSLKKSLYGQDSAIEAVCGSMAKALHEPPRDQPRGIFFFLGPPATGKTFLAELIAKELGNEWHYKFIDMSDYQGESESFGLNGLRKGYSKARPGELTSFVREHPKAVIVFDELDKSHPNNQNILLSILKKGELKDNFGCYVVNFRNTIVIFTTNLGSEIYGNEAFCGIMDDSSSRMEDIIIESLSREKSEYYGKNLPAISSGILSRLAQGRIVLFNRLSFNALKQIATDTFDSAHKGMNQNLDITVTLDHPDRLMEVMTTRRAGGLRKAPKRG